MTKTVINTNTRTYVFEYKLNTHTEVQKRLNISFCCLKRPGKLRIIIVKCNATEQLLRNIIELNNITKQGQIKLTNCSLPNVFPAVIQQKLTNERGF